MQMPKQGASVTVDDNTWKDVMDEIAVLARLDHPNLIALKEYYTTDDSVYLVTNLVQGRDVISDFVFKMNSKKSGILYRRGTMSA